MRVAAFQFDVRRGEVAANLAAVEHGLREAADRDVELVLLPEMWPTSFVSDADDARWLMESEAAVARSAELSRELGLVVAGSAFAAGAPGERLRNRLSVFDGGELVLAYDKVHLFSPTAENLGFSAGGVAPPTALVRGLRLSGVVCYDVRFSPLLRAPYEDGAELLLVPAQWPEARGTHWKALLAGRAVEHQAFVLGANRTGEDTIGRRRLELRFPGNSLVVSPHGKVLAEGAGEDGLVVGDLDLEAVRDLRRLVPVRADERERIDRR